MVKNSFTLFETLISIFLLSIIIVSFSKTYYFDNFDEEYTLLNILDNKFSANTYDDSFKVMPSRIRVIFNGGQEEEVKVNRREFENGKIKLSKYELP